MFCRHRHDSGLLLTGSTFSTKCSSTLFAGCSNWSHRHLIPSHWQLALGLKCSESLDLKLAALFVISQTELSEELDRPQKSYGNTAQTPGLEQNGTAYTLYPVMGQWPEQRHRMCSDIPSHSLAFEYPHQMMSAHSAGPSPGSQQTGKSPRL